MSELRKLPSVTALVHEAAAVFAGETPQARTRLVRAVLDDARRRVQDGAAAPELTALVEAVKARRAADENLRIRRVINATGIPLHTNLGRSPLPRAVLETVVELGVGYCSLELDLATGQRSSRGAGVKAAVRAITGAGDAVVVNNGAAAVFLALSALARGREVIVSRGELVQIGGGFRVPDILAASGARLVEVGTTNITTIADYERAITPDTALLMRIHRSNFVVEGHTGEASMGELSALARRSGLPFFYDLGSGSLVRWAGHDPVKEPTVQDGLRQGADLVAFSGDKLVGGPQAGFVAGDPGLVKALATHPLYRALRPGRLTLVALQEVLRHYVEGDHLALPGWAMIEQDADALAARAEDLARRLADRGVPASTMAAEGAVGGGAAPDKAISSTVVRLAPKDAGAYLARLRAHAPAVVPRIERDVVMVDPRTVLPEEWEALVEALAGAWA